MKKIMIVDDDMSILEPLQLLLEEEGYDVLTLSRGTDAYRLIVREMPDLVFLDMLMSGSDGRTICKSLKKDKKTKNIPVVMMSAHPSASTDSEGCGADGFIAKPFEVDVFLGTIGRFTK